MLKKMCGVEPKTKKIVEIGTQPLKTAIIPKIVNKIKKIKDKKYPRM